MKINVIFRCAIVRCHPLIIMVVLQRVGSQSLWNFGVRTGISRRSWLWDEHRGLLYLVSNWYLTYWYSNAKVMWHWQIKWFSCNACAKLSVPFIKRICFKSCLLISSLSRGSRVTLKPQMVLLCMRQVLDQFSKTICIMRCLLIPSLARESHVTLMQQTVFHRMRQVFGPVSKKIYAMRRLSISRYMPSWCGRNPHRSFFLSRRKVDIPEGIASRFTETQPAYNRRNESSRTQESHPISFYARCLIFAPKLENRN